MLQLNSAGVATGDANTHDFGEALRPLLRSQMTTIINRSQWVLWTAKKAFGGKMASPTARLVAKRDLEAWTYDWDTNSTQI